MKLKKIKKTINNLKVGTFVKCNGSTLYVFKPMKIYMNYPSEQGIFIIEKHPEKSLGWLELRTYNIISTPKRKHVVNAIKQIKDTFKFKDIDNLTYIENLNILKNYNKPAIVSKN